MSFLNLMEDEHIGSFWFRQHAIRGNALNHKHLSRVMTYSARYWRLFPWMGSEYETHEVLHNHTLLNMFWPTGIPIGAFWVGNGDRKGMSSLSNHFGDYRSISVRYCQICFIEQISDKGFVWFKRQWLIFNSAHCVVHKCSLQTFRCDSCGKVPHIHAGIESFLIGRCSMCKQAFSRSKPKRVQKIPPLTLWLNYVLERNLPHFSHVLINRFMYHSYSVYRQEEAEHPEWAAGHIYLLYKEYIKEQVSSSLIWVPDEYNAMYYRDYMERTLRSGSKVPLIMFWVAMMKTFQNFEEFESFLESESILKKGEYGGNLNAEFLDLKHRRSLNSIHRGDRYI